jgi:ABC-type lipoprotein export system ATPase subunit
MKNSETDIRLLHYYNAIPIPLLDTPISGRVWNSNLVLFKGKHYVVKAESGKGKTTFFNLAYGLRQDYRGDVFFNETNIRSLNGDDFAKFRVAHFSYLFQDLRLFGDLSAMENILLNPGNTLTTGEIEFMAEKLGVRNRLDKSCKTLSLGQQQRIALIRALGQNFQWLFLDEPFSHLDDRNASIAMELILERAKAQDAGIVATCLGDTSIYKNFELIEL